jgi:hypothetical protein
MLVCADSAALETAWMVSGRETGFEARDSEADFLNDGIRRLPEGVAAYRLKG